MTALEEFLAAYDRMRDLQKRHFNGEPGLVGKAKVAEAQSDRLRANLANGARTAIQPDLFFGLQPVAASKDDNNDHGVVPWWARE